jgi:hypothetical protein
MMEEEMINIGPDSWEPRQTNTLCPLKLIIKSLSNIHLEKVGAAEGKKERAATGSLLHAVQLRPQSA